MYLEKWNAYNKNQNNRTSILLHWLHSFSETETSWSKIRLGLKKCICLLLLKPPSFGFVWQRGHNGLCNAKTMSLLQRSKTGDHPRWKERCVVQLIFSISAICAWQLQVCTKPFFYWAIYLCPICITKTFKFLNVEKLSGGFSIKRKLTVLTQVQNVTKISV